MVDRPNDQREHRDDVLAGISRPIARAGCRRQRDSAGAGQCQRAQRLGARSQRHRQRRQDTGTAATDDRTGETAHAGAVRRLPIDLAGLQLSADSRSANGKDKANAISGKEIASLGGEGACEQTRPAD
jgi:hypothetical protein